MHNEVIDNSLSDLSFDFLGGIQHERPRAKAEVEAATAEVQDEVATGAEAGAAAEPAAGVAAAELPPAPHPAAPLAEAASRPAAGPGGSTTGVVSAPRRFAWSMFYAVRMVLVALLVCLVGTLVLTLALNPDLTLDGAVRLLIERGAALVGRVADLFA